MPGGQPGMVSNTLIARQSEIFTEFPPEGCFKLFKNMRFLLRNFERFQQSSWLFKGKVDRENI